MARYRIGLMGNAVGNEWYACERNLLGFWIETQTFDSARECLRYGRYLERIGHFVQNVNIEETK